MNTLRPISTSANYQPPDDGFIHIMPFGEYTVERKNPKDPAGDPLRLVLVIDPDSAAAQIAAFNRERDEAGASWGGMLVDFDHFSLDDDKSSEASGWATELAARSDGLWAKVRWTDAGLKAVTGGTYRYTSPVHLPSDVAILGDNRGRPMRLYRLALTNDPRMLKGEFPMQPISSRAVAAGKEPGSAGRKGPDMDALTRKLFCLILGLDPATAKDEEIEAAAGKFGSEEQDEPAHQDLTSRVASLETDNAALKSRAEAAEALVAGQKADATMAALEKDGYAIASRADLRTALIADHDGTVKSARAFKPTAAATGAPAGEPLRSRADHPATGAGATTQADRKAFVDEIQKKYGIRSRAKAVARATQEKPELFR